MVAFETISPLLSTVYETQIVVSVNVDEKNPERPLIAVRNEIGSAMEKLLKKNQNITHREIWQELGAGSSADILRQQRGIRKLANR